MEPTFEPIVETVENVEAKLKHIQDGMPLMISGLGERTCLKLAECKYEIVANDHHDLVTSTSGQASTVIEHPSTTFKPGFVVYGWTVAARGAIGRVHSPQYFSVEDRDMAIHVFDMRNALANEIGGDVRALDFYLPETV